MNSESVSFSGWRSQVKTWPAPTSDCGSALHDADDEAHFLNAMKIHKVSTISFNKPARLGAQTRTPALFPLRARRRRTRHLAHQLANYSTSEGKYSSITALSSLRLHFPLRGESPTRIQESYHCDYCNSFSSGDWTDASGLFARC